MKKILLITNEYPSKVSTFITRDIEVLTSDGSIVDLYAIYPKDELLWDYVPEEGKQLIEKGLVKVKHIGKMEIFFSIICFWNYFSLNFFNEAKKILQQSKKYGNVQWRKSLYTLMWTIALKRREKTIYDKVISYWGNYSATAGYLYSKYTNKKTDFYTYLHAGVDLYRDQIYLLEKLLHAKKIVTVCNFNIQFLKKLYPNDFRHLEHKIIVYHLPLNMKPLEAIEKEDNKIIAVGSLVKAKGIDYLIEACALLKYEGIKFSLSIVGNGKERENLERLVSKNKLDDDIEFLGHLPYDQVEREISSSIVLAHCSPELGDAVPTVIKESLMLGTPVVGSDIVGIPELLDYGKCGLLFTPKDCVSLAKALKEILSNKCLQKDLSKEGRIFAEKMFDIEKNRRILLHALEV